LHAIASGAPGCAVAQARCARASTRTVPGVRARYRRRIAVPGAVGRVAPARG